MTREEARKAAEVMLAYADGKEIEYKCHNFSDASWLKTIDGEPLFNWYTTDYRIKKEPTYRPFRDKEECWAEMQKHKPFGWVVYDYWYDLVCGVSEKTCKITEGPICYKDAFEYLSFPDGTPFGIKEE